MQVYYPSPLKCFIYNIAAVLLAIYTMLPLALLYDDYSRYGSELNIYETFSNFLIIQRALLFEAIIPTTLQLGAFLTLIDLLGSRIIFKSESLRGLTSHHKISNISGRYEIKFSVIKNVSLKRKFLPKIYFYKGIILSDKYNYGIVIPWHIENRNELLQSISEHVQDENTKQKIQKLIH